MISIVKSANDEQFFLNIQKYLNWFVFLLPLGFVKIGGISITFLIFLLITYLFLKKGKKLFKLQKVTDYLLLLFFILSFLSLLFAEETFREKTPLSDVKLIIQLLYWISMALFIKTWAYRFDFYQLSKYFFFGLIAFMFYYYTANIFLHNVPQNFFAYTLVVSTPFALYYTFKRYSFGVNIFIIFIFIATATLSQSRSGAILVFLESVALLSLVKPYLRKASIILSSMLIPLILIISLSEVDLRSPIADVIRDYNPRVATLIESTSEVNVRDKSWLVRKLMVQKGEKIFEEHPFLGIGLGHFTYYWVDLDLFSQWLSRSMDIYNKRSSHNTYVAIIAESGIFALLSFLTLQLLILFAGLRSFRKFEYSPKIFVFLSFFGMSVYFYVISAMTGALTWLIIGLGLTLLNKREVK